MNQYTKLNKYIVYMTEYIYEKSLIFLSSNRFYLYNKIDKAFKISIIQNYHGKDAKVYTPMGH